MFQTIIYADTSLFLFINNNRNICCDIVLWLITHFGNALVAAPLLCVLIFLKCPKIRRPWVLTAAAVAMIIDGVVNVSIKNSVQRLRPPAYFFSIDKKASQTSAIAIQPRQVNVVGKTLRSRSFPSGHTATAFVAATIATFAVSRSFWWSYLIAAAVGYSRVYIGVHFPLDVVAGAAEGFFVALAVILTEALLYSKIKLRNKNFPDRQTK